MRGHTKDRYLGLIRIKTWRFFFFHFIFVLRDKMVLILDIIGDMHINDVEDTGVAIHN